MSGMRSLDIQLIACTSCQQHYRSGTACPHCGHATKEAGVGRTAASVLLGLALATPAALAGCGDETTGSGGNGGAGGASTTANTTQNVSSAYGVGPTTTDASSSSATGTGGAGGGQ